MTEKKYDPSIGTLARFGKIMEVNSLLNIPYIAQSHGVKDWRKKFTGIPAVIVGAGPSLDFDIENLVGLEDRALVITTDRALKPLLAHGIKPHVTVSADMENALGQLYADIDIPSELVLLYDRDAYFPVIKNYQGPRLTYDTYFDTGIWTRSFLGLRGFMHKNLSVGHTAFYLAALAGCSPIITLGIDNAFPGEKTHASGVSDVDGGKIDPAHPSWTITEAVDGKPVRSSQGFTAMARAYEPAIEEQRAHFILTTQIGAKIKGAQWMTFAEAASKHLVKHWNIAGLVKACLKPPLPLDLEMFDLQSGAAKATCEHVKAVADNGLRLIFETGRVDRMKDPVRFQEKLKKADRVRKELLEDRFSQSLLGKMMYRTVYIAERINEDMEDTKELDPRRLWGEAAKLEHVFVSEKDCATAFIRCLEEVGDVLGVSV